MKRPPPTWAYGVTTVLERVNTYLPQTLGSLEAAGFPKPHLYIDGATAEEAIECRVRFGLNVSNRFPLLRVAGNWLLSMLELYLHHPTIDRYAMFQDDIICSHNLRAYLDRCLYPEHMPDGSINRGYWNLCTYPCNEDLVPKDKAGCPVPGWHLSDQRGRGAQGLVFSRPALTALLSSPYMVSRAQDPDRGWRNVDGGIVISMQQQGWKEFVHYPSLIYHIGDMSTFDHYKAELRIPHGTQPDASSFRGEDFDLLSLLPKK